MSRRTVRVCAASFLTLVLDLAPPLSLVLTLIPASAQTTGTPSAADKQAVLTQQKENEDAETLCRGIKDKADFEKCLELYFLDKDAFQKFLQAHGTRAGRP